MKIFFLSQNFKVYKTFTYAAIVSFLVFKNILNSEVFFNNLHIGFLKGLEENVSLQLPIKDEQMPILINFPNPFKTLTYIYIRLPRITDCNVKIYDTFGNLVRTYELLGRDEYIVIWDGKNEAHQQVSSGGYICVLMYDNIKLIRKIGFIR
ncbi:MAG: hypothetical protein RMJ13_02390 [Elusimicrobiota bacterium]|nr:hypothetical protein [Elusimicrobiota bacterium]